MAVDKSKVEVLEVQPIVEFVYNDKKRIVRVEQSSKNGWFRGEVVSESKKDAPVFKTFTLAKVKEGTLVQTGEVKREPAPF